MLSSESSKIIGTCILFVMRTPTVSYGRRDRGIKTEMSAQYFAIIFKAVFFVCVLLRSKR